MPRKIFVVSFFLILLSFGVVSVYNVNPAFAEYKFRKVVSTYTEFIPLEVIEKYNKKIPIERIVSLVDETPLCHHVGHSVGEYIFNTTETLNEALGICGDSCTRGCLHGVMFGLLKERGQAAKEDILSFCFRDDVPEGVVANSCFHSVGHSLMFLFSGDMRESLDECNRFEKKEHAYYCATGVYMDYNISEYGNLYGPQDVLYPCTELKDHPASCYRYTIKRTFEKRLNPETIALECQTIADPQQRRGCFHGLGFALDEKVLENPKAIASICSYGDEVERRMCIEGAIGFIAEKNQKEALAACEFLSDSDKESCIRATALKTFSSDYDWSEYFYIEKGSEN